MVLKDGETIFKFFFQAVPDQVAHHFCSWIHGKPSLYLSIRPSAPPLIWSFSSSSQSAGVSATAIAEEDATVPERVPLLEFMDPKIRWIPSLLD